MSSRRSALVLSVLLGLASLATGSPVVADETDGDPSRVAAVELRVRTVVGGLENP